MIVDLEKTKNLKILLETEFHSVTYCKTGYKRKGQVAEYHPVFGFPDPKPSLKEKWIHFVNRKH